MNRLTNPSISWHGQTSTSQRRVAVGGERPCSQSPAFAYQLLAPVHYEPNYAYPLLIWLHSAGDDQRQLRRVMPHVSLRNYVAVGPRGVVTEPSGYSYCWSPEFASADAAARVLHQSIDVARQQYNVNPRRIFLAGMKDGGTMALRLALSEPEQFAGVISIGGAFPKKCAALSRLNSVRDLPVLIMRGLASLDYPESEMCDEIRLFHAARMRVHLRQYACGDDLIVPMLRDLDAWIMEQVTGVPALAESDAAV
jgi:phospholipase/carboxylesterase